MRNKAIQGSKDLQEGRCARGCVGYFTSRPVVKIVIWIIATFLIAPYSHAESDIDAPIRQLAKCLTRVSIGSIKSVAGSLVNLDLPEGHGLSVGAVVEAFRVADPASIASPQAGHGERIVGEIKLIEVRTQAARGRVEMQYDQLRPGDKIYQQVKRIRRIAVSEFPCNDSFNSLTKTIQIALITHFAQRSMEVVERDQLDRVLQEQKLAHSGLVDISTAQRLGRLTGTQGVVLGTITPSRDNVTIYARLVDIEKALVLVAYSVELRRTPEIDALLTGRRTEPPQDPGSKVLSFSGQPECKFDNGTLKMVGMELDPKQRLLLHIVLDLNDKASARFTDDMWERIFLTDDTAMIYPAVEVRALTAMSSNVSLHDIPKRFSLAFEKYPSSLATLHLQFRVGTASLSFSPRIDLAKRIVSWH